MATILVYQSNFHRFQPLHLRRPERHQILIITLHYKITTDGSKHDLISAAISFGLGGLIRTHTVTAFPLLETLCFKDGRLSIVLEDGTGIEALLFIAIYQLSVSKA
jgi:hypothetical protein